MLKSTRNSRARICDFCNHCRRKIFEQNADEVRGSTLIWNFNILDPRPDFEPYAVVDTTVASSGSSGTSGGLIALIIIAALGSLILLGVLQKRFAPEAKQ
ncbi:MAG: hypothetical protein CM15mP49_02730 [Actinomycetota bacterium]|nr:MAG: hypothetical protein CM15mP49_02730 [Actinomycetota bacterium]